jgi:hypothetical protein
MNSVSIYWVNCSRHGRRIRFRSAAGERYCTIVFIVTNIAQYVYIFLLQQYLYYKHCYMFRYICVILREFQNCTSLKSRSYDILLFVSASRPLLGPPCPLYIGSLSQGIKRPARQVDHILPCINTSVKNLWSYSSVFSYAIMASYSIQHGLNFTSTNYLVRWRWT